MSVQTSAESSNGDTSAEDEDEPAQEDKTASTPLYSKRFMLQSCKASLDYRSGNLEALATVAKPEDDSAAAGVNSADADEASGNNSQETSPNSSNSAEDDDVSLESVD